MVLADIFNTFVQFGPVHFAVLLVVVATGWLLTARRRRLAGEPERRRFDVAVAIITLVLWFANQTVELLPSRYELHRSLPLHVCDVVALVGPIALLTNGRVWRAMLYYWGVGLSTQALITPELAYGLASLHFWSFWVPHGAIISLAIYDLAGRGYRPGWRDYGIAIVTLLIYLAVALPFDLAFHVNYGFVGKGVPGQPSVIDFLGEWPVRLYKLVTAVAVFLALITLPWVIARRVAIRRRGPGGPAPAQDSALTVARRPVTPPTPRSPIESLESRASP